METRLLIAYGLMLILALAAAALAYRVWYRAPVRAIPRERLRQQRRAEQRRLERIASDGQKLT